MCDLPQRLIYRGSLFSSPFFARTTIHLPSTGYPVAFESRVFPRSYLSWNSLRENPFRNHAPCRIATGIVPLYLLNFERSMKIGPVRFPWGSIASNSAIRNQEVRSTNDSTYIRRLIVRKLSRLFGHVIGQGSIRGHSRSHRSRKASSQSTSK